MSPESIKRVQRAAIGIGVAGVLLFSGVIYVAYPAILAAAKEDAEEPAVAEANGAAAAPAPAVQAAAAPTPPSPANPTAPAPTPASAPAPAPQDTAVPPAGAATSAASVSAIDGEPSAAFKTWVSQVKIGGVRVGAVPRILVAGKSFNLGEVVQPELGIVFANYDAARHMVRFKDATGATLERRDR